MNAEMTFPDARVVVLSREAALMGLAGARLHEGGDRCLWAPSAYEAAAEALAGEAACLVVDLACLTARQAGLLRIYQARSLPVVALGAPPAWLSDADRAALRIVTAQDLPDAVAAALAAASEPPLPVDPDDDLPAVSPSLVAAQSLISAEELAALLEREP